MKNNINENCCVDNNFYKKKKQKKRIKISDFELSMMALPGLLVVFLFAYVPMFGIILAFKKYRAADGIFGSPWVGFKNFEFFFKSQDAWIVTRNTILLNAAFIFTSLIISVVLALLLNSIKKRSYVKIYQTTILLPHFLSWVVVGYLLFALLNMDLGIFNRTLASVGIAPVQWYIRSELWPAILIFANIWKTVGYSSIIYYAALMGIDKEYYEAAKIDGATKFQMAIKISVPLIMPLITVMTLLAIGRVIRADFGMFYFLTRGVGLLFPTTGVIDTYVFNMLKNTGDVGMSTAIGLFQSIVGFVMIILANIAVKKIDSDNAIF